MLSALLKKQFSEIANLYLRNKKTGSQRTKGGAVGMLVLYVFLFIIFSGMFFSVAAMLSLSLVPQGLTWLYFSLMSVIAVFFGVVGGIFNTYAGLYHAKDNELLLSMPIPPSKILFVRMVGVYAMGFLYEAIVFIPTLIAYFIFGAPSPLSVVNSVLLIFIIGFLVLALTCFFGWIIAIISGKLKNKSFITVIVSLLFLGVYFYFCTNMYSALQSILDNAQKISAIFQNAVYPMYLLGRAAEGDAVSMLLFTVMIAAIFALTYFIMSKSFIKITTKSTASVKTKYTEKTVKARGAEAAFLRKELKRFTSSATYMLNCGLGSAFMIAGAIVSLIFADDIRNTLELFMLSEKYITIAAMTLILCVSAMNPVTAPSISLEGKNIWIAQSMPVDTSKIFSAKLHLSYIITIPPAVLLSVCVSIVIKADFYSAALMTFIVVCYTMLLSALGLLLNLKNPNLTWTNETVPIKQGMPGMIYVFGGLILAVVIGLAGCFALQFMEAHEYFIIALIATAVASRLINSWLMRKGTKIFQKL